MRHFVLAIFVLSIYIKPVAQTSFGPTAALNIATQSWKGNNAGNYRLTPFIGLQAGVFGNYKLNEKFAAHAEIVYSAEGTREKNISSGGSGYANFNYVRIPLLVQYYIIEDLYGEAGANVGIFVGGKEKFDGETRKLRAGYKTVDVGVNVGAGYNLSKFVEGLTAGVRFNYGLSSIVKAENLNGGTGFRNRVFSINVRYTLPFGKE